MYNTKVLCLYASFLYLRRVSPLRYEFNSDNRILIGSQRRYLFPNWSKCIIFFESNNSAALAACRLLLCCILSACVSDYGYTARVAGRRQRGDDPFTIYIAKDELFHFIFIMFILCVLCEFD